MVFIRLFAKTRLFSLILLKLILKIHFLLTKNKKDAIILYVKVSSIIVIGGWLDVGISRL